MHAGQAGDLADAKGPAGNKAQWLPRKGTLSWRHVPGHAPGMVGVKIAAPVRSHACRFVIIPWPGTCHKYVVHAIQGQ